MVETLLAVSTIKLYGRIVTDLSYNYNSKSVVTGANRFLQNQFATGANIGVTGIATAGSNVITGVNTLVGLGPGMTVAVSYNQQVFATVTTILGLGPVPNSFSVSSNALNGTNNVAVPITATFEYTEPQFARIYAFTFEGAVYNLPRPSIFLVHGAGAALDIRDAPGNVGRSTMDQSGVIAREWEFAASSAPPGAQPDQGDLRYWEYEKADFSIRLDPEAGPFDQILLAAALRSGGDMADRSGQGLGVRSGQGLDSRSGQGLDTRSGQGLRR
jgi:hypothetical protein